MGAECKGGNRVTHASLVVSVNSFDVSDHYHLVCFFGNMWFICTLTSLLI